MAESRRPNLDRLVDIRQADIDAAAVLAQLQARLIEHGALWRRTGHPFLPSYADLLKQANKPPTNALEYYLWRLAQTDVRVTPYVIPSPLPIVGKAIDWFKGQFHRLVLYYVNILAGKQGMYNAQVYQVLRRLAVERRSQAEGGNGSQIDESRAF